jgi:hypothetical protein
LYNAAREIAVRIANFRYVGQLNIDQSEVAAAAIRTEYGFINIADDGVLDGPIYRIALSAILTQYFTCIAESRVADGNGGWCIGLEHLVFGILGGNIGNAHAGRGGLNGEGILTHIRPGDIPNRGASINMDTIATLTNNDVLQGSAVHTENRVLTFRLTAVAPIRGIGSAAAVKCLTGINNNRAACHGYITLGGGAC